MPTAEIRTDKSHIQTRVKIRKNSKAFVKMLQQMDGQESVKYLTDLNAKMKSRGIHGVILSDVTIIHDHDMYVHQRTASYNREAERLFLNGCDSVNIFSNDSNMILIGEDLPKHLYQIAMNIIQLRIPGVINHSMKNTENWWKSMDLNSKKTFLGKCGFHIVDPKFTSKHFIITPAVPIALDWGIKSDIQDHLINTMYRRVKEKYYLTFNGETLPVLFPIAGKQEKILIDGGQTLHQGRTRTLKASTKTGEKYCVQYESKNHSPVRTITHNTHILDMLHFEYCKNGMLPEECFMVRSPQPKNPELSDVSQKTHNRTVLGYSIHLTGEPVHVHRSFDAYLKEANTRRVPSSILR